MNTARTLLLTLASALFLLSGCSREKQAPAKVAALGTLVPAAAITDKAWLAKAVAEYPMTTCIISGDKLGDMGSPLDYVYRVAGKPDRLVRFCCKDCPPDFIKDADKLMDEIAKGDVAKPATKPAMTH